MRKEEKKRYERLEKKKNSEKKERLSGECETRR